MFIANGALDATSAWVDVRGREPGPLFTRLRRRPGRQYDVSLERLSGGTIVEILERRAKEAGIDAPIRPHDLRRTVAGEMLTRGEDISTVAKVLGHASVKTTQRYDVRPEATIAAAAAKIRFPSERW